MAVGREDELLRAVPKVGPVDPFARRGEQDLLDQIATCGRPLTACAVRPPPSKPIGKGDVLVMRLSPAVCVTMTVSGVPVGVQTTLAVLQEAPARPWIFTRVAPFIHCAVAQGGLDVPVRAQPATAYASTV